MAKTSFFPKLFKMINASVIIFFNVTVFYRKRKTEKGQVYRKKIEILNSPFFLCFQWC